MRVIKAGVGSCNTLVSKDCGRWNQDESIVFAFICPVYSYQVRGVVHRDIARIWVGVLFASWCHLLRYMWCLGEAPPFVNIFLSLMRYRAVRWVTFNSHVTGITWVHYVCLWLKLCVCVCARLYACMTVSVHLPEMCHWQIWQNSSPH